MTTDNELKKVLDIPRKGLIYLRKQYNTNLVKAALVIVSAVLATVCLGLIADAFLPLSSFMNWAIVVKTFIAVPTAVSIFSLAYMVSLFFHNSKVNSDPSWVPYRSRYSPKQRLYLVGIVGALAFVFNYGWRTSTLAASLVIAVLIACLVFLRLDRTEQQNFDTGVVDIRDIEAQKRIKENQKARARKARDKERRKRERRRKWFGPRGYEDDEE